MKSYNLDDYDNMATMEIAYSETKTSYETAIKKGREQAYVLASWHEDMNPYDEVWTRRIS